MKIDGNELAILQNDLDRPRAKAGGMEGQAGVSEAGPGEWGSLSLSGEVPAPWQLL